MQPDQILPEKEESTGSRLRIKRDFKPEPVPEPEPQDPKLTFQQKIDAGYYAV